MSLGSWSTAHKDAISAIGVAVAAIGFFATTVGLILTTIQIHEAKRVLQSTNAYQIQKDARELADKIIGEYVETPQLPKIKFRELITESSVEKQKKYEQEAAPKFAQILNFYLSIYRQYKSEGISESFASAFRKDFCYLFKAPGFQIYWNTRVQSSSPPSSEMRELKDGWCS